jgi:hypothetical protein
MHFRQELQNIVDASTAGEERLMTEQRVTIASAMSPGGANFPAIRAT